MGANDLLLKTFKTAVGETKLPNQNLARALTEYAACEEGDHAARIKVLQEIAKQAEALHAVHKKGTIAEYLELALKEAATVRKKLEAAMVGTATAVPADAEETKDWQGKLINALARVKAAVPGPVPPGPEATPPLRFLAYVLSGSCSVLVRAHVASAKGLVKSIAGDVSGGVFHEGECIFEKGAHTFVLEQVPSGLAKKLSQALLTETGLKYHVRVRGLDGVVEGDEEVPGPEKSPASEPDRAAAELVGSTLQKITALGQLPPEKLAAVLGTLIAKFPHPESLATATKLIGGCQAKLHAPPVSAQDMAIIVRNLKVAEILVKEQAVNLLLPGVADLRKAQQIGALVGKAGEARAQQAWDASMHAINVALNAAMPAAAPSAPAQMPGDASELLRAKLREKLGAWRQAAPSPLNDAETKTALALLSGDEAALSHLAEVFGKAEAVHAEVSPLLEGIAEKVKALNEANARVINGAVSAALAHPSGERLAPLLRITQKLAEKKAPRARPAAINPAADGTTVNVAQELAALREAEAAAARRAIDTAEAKRQADAAEANRVADEAEAKRVADEAEAMRQADAAEAKRIADEAAAQRVAEAAESKRKAEAVEAQRKAAAAEVRRRETEQAEAERLRVESEAQAEVARKAKLRERASQLRQEINRLLQNLHQDIQDSPQNQALISRMTEAGPDDLETLDKARQDLEKLTATVAAAVQKRREAIAEMLRSLHPTERGRFASATQQASQPPSDLAGLKKIADGLAARLELIQERVAEEKVNIAKLTGALRTLGGEGGAVMELVTAALSENPPHLQAVETARKALLARIVELRSAPGTASKAASPASAARPVASPAPAVATTATAREAAFMTTVQSRHPDVAASLQEAVQGTAPSGLRVQLFAAVQFGPTGQPALNYAGIPGLNAQDVQAREELARQRVSATAAVIRDFKDFPELSLDALDVLQTAEHPEAFAQGVAQLGQLLKGGFGGSTHHPLEARTMAKNGLKLAGLVGGEKFFEEMVAYYENDPAATKPDPIRADPRAPDSNGAALLYGREIGQALVNGAGKLDPANIRPARDRLRFHPESLKDPLATVTSHVERLHGQILQNPAAFQSALDGVTAPKGASAQGLVQATLGLPGAAGMTKTQAQQAVMSALATPLRQGDVGACFATCNCLDMQQQKPEEMTRHLAKMVSTGTLGLGQLDPIPVVTDRAPDRNNLLDSYQYTLATLGECEDNNQYTNRAALRGQELGHEFAEELV